MSDKREDNDSQNSITRPCSCPVCPCALDGVFHRRDDRSPNKRRVANRVGHCPVQGLSRNRHRSFCLDINTLIR